MDVWDTMCLYDRFVTVRQVQMERDRQPYEEAQREIVERLRPDMTGDPVRDRGRVMGADIVEGSGPFHAGTMSKWFVGNLVGPLLDWLRYRMSDRTLKGDDDINQWLQNFTDFMLYDVYPYPASNFYEINTQFVLDGLTTGSPVMLVETDSDKKVCTLPHYTENYLIRDWFGSDVAYHRKWKISNFAAMQAFGESLPRAIREEIAQGNYFTEHTYLMCICRAGDTILQYKSYPPNSNVPIIRPWMQFWFCCDSTQVDEKKPLNYTLNTDQKMMPTSAPGYWHKPFHAWHYARTNSETYSRTPGWYSLPDVRGLNSAWRTIHEVAHKIARPPSYALDSLKGRLKLGANGVTWVTEGEYDRPPRPVDERIQYQWAMDFIERRTQTVGRHFYADMARMIENYSREHKQPPTAYQLAQMVSETMVLVGPAITSYVNKYLSGIDDMFVEIEMRKGRLLDQTNPPDKLYETNGEITPEFRGPLLGALKYATMVKRIQQPLTMAAPVLEVWPESRDKIRAADLLERILEEGDFPQDAIVGADEYEAIQDAKLQERNQQVMLDRMSQMSEIVPKLQGQTMSASPLQRIVEAA